MNLKLWILIDWFSEFEIPWNEASSCLWVWRARYSDRALAQAAPGGNIWNFAPGGNILSFPSLTYREYFKFCPRSEYFKFCPWSWEYLKFCTDLSLGVKYVLPSGGLYLPARFNVVWPEGNSAIPSPSPPTPWFQSQIFFLKLCTIVHRLDPGCLACVKYSTTPGWPPPSCHLPLESSGSAGLQKSQTQVWCPQNHGT